MKWRKISNTPVWRTKKDEFFLLVQKRSGRKSHPQARYYWVVSKVQLDGLAGYAGYDYEMSIKKAMTAAKGAVLEARICASIDA